MLRRSLPLIVLLATVSVAQAHPVPRGNHDRTITVKLSAEHDQLVVTVAYRLEVDEATVTLEDLPPLRDQLDLGRYKTKQGALHNEYTRLYAPILAGNLIAKAGDKTLRFTCDKPSHTLREDNDPLKPLLGHLRCDFTFRATIPSKPGEATPFTFREGNYVLQEGLIDVGLVGDSILSLKGITVADDALKKLEIYKRKPGDEDRLREVSAVVTPPASTVAFAVVPEPPLPTSDHPQAERHLDLVHLFLETDYAVWLLLLLAFFVGAAHALTPGHGKTLVAAYLVGENGTVLHALVLGLVTTFTHTGVVLLLAIILQWFFPSGASAAVRANIQAGLGLVMGLLVVCMGFWLLLKRATGGVDHVHLPGTAHHHHHGSGHHHHHHEPPAGGWWGLVLLGINGGIVPCWDAIAILVLAVGSDRAWLAFPMVLAFSAGLASVLVLLGIVVVRAKRLAQSRWGEGSFVRALPIISAVCVIALGFYLCYTSVSAARPTASAAVSRP